METIMKTCAAVVALVLMPLTGWAQENARPPSSPDREQVIAVVQKLFDAMASHDATALREVMVPEGRLFSTNDARAATAVRSRSLQEFIDEIGRSTQKLLERMWNPEVRVHGGIATLWANYDFHLDGKFSHCGIDAFDLVRTADGWKVTGGSYTIERTGCAPSPLGEPK
jgi:hypothetical protein